MIVLNLFMKIKIKVNEKCIGCGSCIAIAPEVFEFSEEGFSRAKKDIIEDEKNLEKVKEAAESCPAEAIEIKELTK